MAASLSAQDVSNLPSFDPGPSDPSFHLPHTLNQTKQTSNLINNATKQDVVFEISPSLENVNVLCNPGFYQHIARPAVSTLSKGFTFSIGDINLSCSEITPSLDMNGIEQTLLFKFNFIVHGCPSLVSVHLHHSKQKVQVQGSAKMPDQNTSAIWFVLNGMYDRFLLMSKNNQHHITAFNDALLTISSPAQPDNSKLVENVKNLTIADLSQSHAWTAASPTTQPAASRTTPAPPH